MAAMPADLTVEVIQGALTTAYVGRRLVVVERATSTMDLAAEEAASGAPEGTVVIAEEQTAGRGRFGRPWVSPRGAALYVSILLRPAPGLLPGVNMAAPLAAVEAARDAAQVDAEIKWPNDVQVRGRKLAGVLVDASAGTTDQGFAIVGVGLNVDLDVADYPEIAEIATSLRVESGRAVGRLAVLAALLSRFEALYDRVKAGESLVGEWRGRLNVIGKRVVVTFPGLPEAPAVEGIAEDVDGDGALLLRKDDGAVERLVAGEVSLG